MNQQNRNMNYNQYSRDVPANGYGNGNRMERASNWRPMQSSSGNYNSNTGGGGYNNSGAGYNSNSNGSSMVSYPTLTQRNRGNMGPTRPSRQPLPAVQPINRSRNGPSYVNQSTRPPLKRAAPAPASRPPPPLELPPLGEPGGLDDPLRRGLSGAGKKWYTRYLAKGMKPELARQKAEEHRRNPEPGPPTAKRPKSADPSKPANTGPAKPANSKDTKAPQGAAPTRPIRVAVLPKDYPRQNLKPEELVQLEEAIIDEVALGYDKKIHFTGIEHRTNMMIVECKDWDTYGWLKLKIPTLSSWKGVELVPRMENRVPKVCKIRLHLPRSADKTEQLLKLLGAQNDGFIHVDRWLVESCTEENEGQTLEITIDEFIYRNIAKIGNALCYRYETVPVVKIEEPTTEAVDKAEGDSEAAEPAKPAATKPGKVDNNWKKTTIRVAVLPKEYPRVTLEQDQLKELEEAIINEVALGTETKVRFTGVEHGESKLVVDCKDWDTFGWMKSNVAILSGWTGPTLVACLDASVPKKIDISVHLPRSSGKSHETLLKLIKAQNEGLHTDCWRINSSTEENDGQTLNITIDGGARRVISKNGNALSYRYGDVPVVWLDKPKPGSDDEPTEKVEGEEGDDEEGDEIDGDAVEINEDEDQETPENGAADNEEK